MFALHGRGMILLWLAAFLGALVATQPLPGNEREARANKPVGFACPMDRDVRSAQPGKCRKCGMALVAALTDALTYPIRLRVRPAAVRPGRQTSLEFEVLDPWTGKRVKDFELVHEKLFHLLMVSRDLEEFYHEHPQQLADGRYRLKFRFPKGGTYRMLCDFYPTGGLPQISTKTVTTAGYMPGMMESRPDLRVDLLPKRGENLAVSLRTEPALPIAGKKSLLFFDLDTNAGLELFLGAWAHLLVVSSDTVDMIHSHPAIADGGRTIQFNVIFPRPGMYRMWVQVQRLGAINTVPFTIRAAELEEAARAPLPEATR
jgi:hypothetical protein